MVNLTFENAGSDWINFKSVKVHFDHPEFDKQVKILSGRELEVYHRSISQLRAIKDHNTSVALGLWLPANHLKGSDSRLAQAIGLGLVGSLTLNQINQGFDSLNTGSMFPSNHLMA